ncbi:Centrosomal protein cep57L1 [Batrachochytrium dendrobatidis]|nr:Centrosomal protein cep57L1 [Batrachochytrium dendrobatidis]
MTAAGEVAHQHLSASPIIETISSNFRADLDRRNTDALLELNLQIDQLASAPLRSALPPYDDQLNLSPLTSTVAIPMTMEQTVLTQSNFNDNATPFAAIRTGEDCADYSLNYRMLNAMASGQNTTTGLLPPVHTLPTESTILAMNHNLADISMQLNMDLADFKRLADMDTHAATPSFMHATDMSSMHMNSQADSKPLNSLKQKVLQWPDSQVSGNPFITDSLISDIPGNMMDGVSMDRDPHGDFTLSFTAPHYSSIFPTTTSISAAKPAASSPTTPVPTQKLFVRDMDVSHVADASADFDYNTSHILTQPLQMTQDTDALFARVDRSIDDESFAYADYDTHTGNAIYSSHTPYGPSTTTSRIHSLHVSPDRGYRRSAQEISQAWMSVSRQPNLSDLQTSTLAKVEELTSPPDANACSSNLNVENNELQSLSDRLESIRLGTNHSAYNGAAITVADTALNNLTAHSETGQHSSNDMAKIDNASHNQSSAHTQVPWASASIQQIHQRILHGYNLTSQSQQHDQGLATSENPRKSVISGQVSRDGSNNGIDNLHFRRPLPTTLMDVDHNKTLYSIPADENSRAVVNALRTLQERVGKLEGEKMAAKDKISDLELELSTTRKLLYHQQQSGFTADSFANSVVNGSTQQPAGNHAGLTVSDANPTSVHNSTAEPHFSISEPQLLHQQHTTLQSNVDQVSAHTPLISVQSQSQPVSSTTTEPTSPNLKLISNVPPLPATKTSTLNDIAEARQMVSDLKARVERVRDLDRDVQGLDTPQPKYSTNHLAQSAPFQNQDFPVKLESHFESKNMPDRENVSHPLPFNTHLYPVEKTEPLSMNPAASKNSYDTFIDSHRQTPSMHVQDNVPVKPAFENAPDRTYYQRNRVLYSSLPQENVHNLNELSSSKHMTPPFFSDSYHDSTRKYESTTAPVLHSFSTSIPTSMPTFTTFKSTAPMTEEHRPTKERDNALQNRYDAYQPTQTHRFDLPFKVSATGDADCSFLSEAEINRLQQDIQSERLAHEAYQRQPSQAFLKQQLLDQSKSIPIMASTAGAGSKKKQRKHNKVPTYTPDNVPSTNSTGSELAPQWRKIEQRGRSSLRGVVNPSTTLTTHIRRRPPIDMPSVVQQPMNTDPHGREMPFTVGQCTGKSFSVTANLQRVFSLLKAHNPGLCSVCSRRRGAVCQPSHFEHNKGGERRRTMHVVDGGGERGRRRSATGPSAKDTRMGMNIATRTFNHAAPVRQSNSTRSSTRVASNADDMHISTDLDADVSAGIASAGTENLHHVLGILEEEFRTLKGEYNHLVSEYEKAVDSTSRIGDIVRDHDMSISNMNGDQNSKKNLKAIGDELRLVIQNMETKGDQVSILREIMQSTLKHNQSKSEYAAERKGVITSHSGGNSSNNVSHRAAKEKRYLLSTVTSRSKSRESIFRNGDPAHGVGSDGDGVYSSKSVPMHGGKPIYNRRNDAVDGQKANIPRWSTHRSASHSPGRLVASLSLLKSSQKVQDALVDSVSNI